MEEIRKKLEKMDRKKISETFGFSVEGSKEELIRVVMEYLKLLKEVKTFEDIQRRNKEEEKK